MKIFILILISGCLNAQNLVQNSGFEIYTNCPNSDEQINRATFWDRPPNVTGTPDYYNSCNNTYWGVPNNKTGFQEANDGTAYVGIVTYYDFPTNPNYREYIQTHLSTPLVAGQVYQLSFKINLADNSRMASNKMGAVFTVEQLSGNGNALPINITPQILNQSIISDTSGWTEISGTYVASGGEQYLTIGNFFSDAETEAQLSNPTWTPIIAYYFIDNVSVINSALGIENFNNAEIKIFPNPTFDKFSISSIENEVVTSVELYSQYNMIKFLNIDQNLFDIKDLQSGIYYVIIKFETGKRMVKKIIKI